MSKQIAVFGLGYVGLSNAVLLAQHNHVTAIDINPVRVEMTKNHQSAIVDKEISSFLSEKELDLTATLDRKQALFADYVLIATPTNYDENTGCFDTSSVEEVIDFINKNTPPRAQLPLIIVKSTIPIGFIRSQKAKGYENVLFMPEFLREGRALYDNLHPSRIVIGEKSQRAKDVAQLYVEAAYDNNIPIVLIGPDEAEAIKLFANTYLAMRVAYINELDTFAGVYSLNTKEILDGMTLDPRIGTQYRNPSFGYGGYCLPKDTKQLLANCSDVPQKLIKAIVEANVIRLDWIAGEVLKKSPNTVGFYRLIMKSDSDNFRASAMLQLLERFKQHNEVQLVIYEPTWKEDEFQGIKVVNNLDAFKKMTDVILANRVGNDLADVVDKVFSRDVYHMN